MFRTAAALAAIAAAAAAVAPAPAPAPAPTLPPALSFTLPADTPVDEQILFYALQGLVNREAANLWLVTPIFWSDPNSTAWFRDEYLSAKFQFTHVSGWFCDLLMGTGAVASGVVSGMALYNETALDATRWLAVTAGALQGLLPVSARLLTNTSYRCINPLPATVDYSNPAVYGWTSNVDAYQWGATHLLPAGCSNTSIYSAGQSFTDATESVALGSDPAILIGLDGAVAKRMFVFNLSPDSQKYPAHAAQFTALVAAVHAGDPAGSPYLYGWAEPEPDMTAATSKGGGAVLCDGAPNFSFWGHLPGAPALPYNDAGVPLQTDHVYITWQSNEGDTPKIAAALQQGAWLDPARGSVPVAWGVNPALLDVAPGLLQFYADTATKNDTFFAATAGAGYSFPWMMPAANFATYVARMRSLVRALTPGWPAYSWLVDVWDSNVPANVSTYAAAAGDVLGAMTMQPEAMENTNTWLTVPGEPGPFPLVVTNKSLWYPFFKPGDPCPAGDPDAEMVRRVIGAVANIPTRPVFLVVYGALLDYCNNTLLRYAAAVQAALGGGDAASGTPPVSVVGMQDWVRLARQAGAAAAAAAAAGKRA